LFQRVSPRIGAILVPPRHLIAQRVEHRRFAGIENGKLPTLRHISTEVVPNLEKSGGAMPDGGTNVPRVVYSPRMARDLRSETKIADLWRVSGLVSAQG
jgi:hypothetical protein